MRQALDAATARETAQLATVVAEAGMGKSRLVAELLSQLTTETVEVRTAVCPSYGEAAGLQVIGRLLGEDPGQPEDLASRYDAYERWAGTLRTAAGDRPLVVFVDDLHWADELVTGFLVHLLSVGDEGPLLVLVAARPELHRRHPAWGQGAAAATSLRLGPLGSRDVDALVDSLAAAGGRSEAERIAEQSGGVPLHAVELARLAGAGAPAVEPGSTLTSVLQARLDTLSPSARATVVDASVVGKRFRIGALAALSARPLAEVQTDVPSWSSGSSSGGCPLTARPPTPGSWSSPTTWSAPRPTTAWCAATRRSVIWPPCAGPSTRRRPIRVPRPPCAPGPRPRRRGRGRRARRGRAGLAQRHAYDAGTAALGLETDAAIRLLRRAVELAQPGGSRWPGPSAGLGEGSSTGLGSRRRDRRCGRGWRVWRASPTRCASRPPCGRCGTTSPSGST